MKEAKGMLELRMLYQSQAHRATSARCNNPNSGPVISENETYTYRLCKKNTQAILYDTCEEGSGWRDGRGNREVRMVADGVKTANGFRSWRSRERQALDAA